MSNQNLPAKITHSMDSDQWLKDIFTTPSREELLFTKIKYQIIDRYNLEKNIAAQMAIDIIETFSDLDINPKALSELLVH